MSLSRYSTVGSLMGNLISGRMAIEGRLPRLVHKSLYQRQMLRIRGLLKRAALFLVRHANAIIRPKLKLH